MTDIVEQLRAPHCGFRGDDDAIDPAVAEEAAKEIDRLRTAFLRYVQDDNECVSGRNGQPCRAKEHCGCYLEMQAVCQQQRGKT